MNSLEAVTRRGQGERYGVSDSRRVTTSGTSLQTHNVYSAFQSCYDFFNKVQAVSKVLCACFRPAARRNVNEIGSARQWSVRKILEFFIPVNFTEPRGYQDTKLLSTNLEVRLRRMTKPLKDMTPDEVRAYKRATTAATRARQEAGLPPLRRQGQDARPRKGKSPPTGPNALVTGAVRVPRALWQRFDAAQIALAALHPEAPLEWDKTALTQALEKFVRQLEKKYNGGKPFTTEKS